MTTGALDGIRVLDLSRILAAPLATQMLGDLGADIIKVERPIVGDDARHYGPPFLDDDSTAGMAAFYLSCNRNKKSLTLDFATGAGRDVLLRLLAQCDVLVENFRPGVLAKYGLGYEDVAAIFPGLIYVSVTGFGQTGPYRDRAGYDGIFQAMTGMMAVSGLPDGVPGAGPMKSGLSLVDILTGLYTSSAILAALRHRDRTGAGQRLDVSLTDCGLASLSHYAQWYLVSGAIPERRGNGGFGGIPSQAFTGSDGELFFMVATTNPQFGRACEAIGNPELIDDVRFGSIAARIEHRLELLGVLDRIFITNTSKYWIERLEHADVPVSRVNDIADALSDPHLVHRAMQVDMHHDSFGEIPTLRFPIRMSGTPVETYGAPPLLGEDTRGVLARLAGCDDDEIAALAAHQVI